MNNTRIIVAGIGGVGGYFGGLLAHHFYGNENIKINFVARGENLKAIQKNGLKVIKGENEFIARPHMVTDRPAEIGIADLIIVCTKSFDLETVIHQLKPCISRDTIILPLLNGVESKETIRGILPDPVILEGCVYIVSRLKLSGVVENSGNIQTLYFGPENIAREKLQWFERLFKQAGIEATLSGNISTITWEKLIFLSPTATATTYFDKCIGEILSDTACLEVMKALIEEAKKVAKAKQIPVSEGITEKTINQLRALPFEATSSMHTDFKNKKAHTELETLTGFIIRGGLLYHISTPTYLTAYTKLKKTTC